MQWSQLFVLALTIMAWWKVISVSCPVLHTQWILRVWCGRLLAWLSSSQMLCFLSFLSRSSHGLGDGLLAGQCGPGTVNGRLWSWTTRVCTSWQKILWVNCTHRDIHSARLMSMVPLAWIILFIVSRTGLCAVSYLQLEDQTVGCVV